MSATKGAQEYWQMLTFADKGGGGVWQIADITDQNALKEPKNIFYKKKFHAFKMCRGCVDASTAP